MERRRLIEEPEQLNLVLPVGRRRVELDEEKGSEGAERGGFVVGGMQCGAVEYTEWEGKLAPPCSGFWEVRPKSAPDLVRRFYYGPLSEGWVWWDPSAHQTSEEGRGLRIDHAVLIAQHEWRGLKAPAASYDYLIKHPEPAGTVIMKHTADGVRVVQSTPKRRRIIE